MKGKAPHQVLKVVTHVCRSHPTRWYDEANPVASVASMVIKVFEAACTENYRAVGGHDDAYKEHTTMPSAQEWNEGNRKVIDEFRANGGKDGIILITMTGAKTGKPYTIPLNYTRDGDRLFVIASKGGSPTNPDWYHNLLAHPNVTIEEGSETFAAHAVVAEGEERQRLFDMQAVRWPFFAEYQKNTKRQIPVVIFERR